MPEHTLTASGEQTREALLAAARSIFIESGYPAMSMRSVAQARGVSLGHLQHFFPTKSSLVAEMLKEAVADYKTTYRRFITSLTFGPRERLIEVVRYLIEDARNPMSARFFIELWSVALHDDEAREVLRENYRHNRHSFEPLLSAVRPDLPVERIRTLATQVIAFVDGIIVYWHSDHPSDSEFEALSDLMRRTVLMTIDTAE